MCPNRSCNMVVYIGIYICDGRWFLRRGGPHMLLHTKSLFFFRLCVHICEMNGFSIINNATKYNELYICCVLLQYGLDVALTQIWKWARAERPPINYLILCERAANGGQVYLWSGLPSYVNFLQLCNGTDIEWFWLWSNLQAFCCVKLHYIIYMYVLYGLFSAIYEWFNLGSSENYNFISFAVMSYPYYAMEHSSCDDQILL